MQFLRNIFTRFPRLKRFSKSIYYFLRGEPQVNYSEISEELIKKCVNKPNPTLLEIGCNSGGHTLWIHKMFKKPTIYCFEPDPRAIGRFRKNIEKDHPDITLFEMALSDQNGEISFHQSGGSYDEAQAKAMPEGYDLSGSIRKPKDHLEAVPWVTFGNTITVKTRTLDSWCEEHGIEEIDFIWMDVQGAELDVFKGSINTLRKTRFVYTEYSDRQMYEGQASLKQLIDYLGHFKVLVRFPHDVLLWNTKFEFQPESVLKYIKL